MKLLSCELHTCQVLLGTWVVLYESSQCCNLMEAHVLPPNECQEATQLWMVPLETQLLPSAPLPPPATNALCRMKTTTKALEISIFIHNFFQEMHLPWGREKTHTRTANGFLADVDELHHAIEAYFILVTLVLPTTESTLILCFL